MECGAQMVPVPGFTTAAITARVHASTLQRASERTPVDPLALAPSPRSMRVLFVVLLLAEACLLCAPLMSSGLNRPKTARAWHEWHQNPTPETEQAWKIERARRSRMEVAAGSVLAVILAINSTGLYLVGRRLFRTRAGRESGVTKQ